MNEFFEFIKLSIFVLVIVWEFLLILFVIERAANRDQQRIMNTPRKDLKLREQIVVLPVIVVLDVVLMILNIIKRIVTGGDSTSREN